MLCFLSSLSIAFFCVQKSIISFLRNKRVFLLFYLRVGYSSQKLFYRLLPKSFNQSCVFGKHVSVSQKYMQDFGKGTEVRIEHLYPSLAEKR